MKSLVLLFLAANVHAVSLDLGGGGGGGGGSGAVSDSTKVPLAGNATVTGPLTFESSATFKQTIAGSSATFSSNTVTGTLNVTNGATVGQLVSAASATFSSNTVTATFSASSAATFGQSVTVSDDADVVDDVSVGDKLIVGGISTFRNNLIVDHADGITVQNGSGSSRLLIGPLGGGSYLQMQGGGDFTLFGNASETMIKVKDSRATGISVIAPTAMLHVSSAPSGGDVSVQIDGNAPTAFKIGASSFSIDSNGMVRTSSGVAAATLDASSSAIINKSLIVRENAVASKFIGDGSLLTNLPSSFALNYGSVTMNNIDQDITSAGVGIATMNFTLPANPALRCGYSMVSGLAAGANVVWTLFLSQNGNTYVQEWATGASTPDAGYLSGTNTTGGQAVDYGPKPPNVSSLAAGATKVVWYTETGGTELRMTAFSAAIVPTFTCEWWSTQ